VPLISSTLISFQIYYVSTLQSSFYMPIRYMLHEYVIYIFGPYHSHITRDTKALLFSEKIPVHISKPEAEGLFPCRCLLQHSLSQSEISEYQVVHR